MQTFLSGAVSGLRGGAWMAFSLARRHGRHEAQLGRQMVHFLEPSQAWLKSRSVLTFPSPPYPQPPFLSRHKWATWLSGTA
jgi:hypothetical protein